jgi:hypothetical protein
MLTATHLAAVVPDIFDITSPPPPFGFRSNSYPVSHFLTEINVTLCVRVYTTVYHRFHLCVRCICENLKNMHKRVNMTIDFFLTDLILSNSPRGRIWKPLFAITALVWLTFHSNLPPHAFPIGDTPLWVPLPHTVFIWTQGCVLNLILETA